MTNTPVNLYHAKTHLSALVERAARGEEVVIAKAGRPRARLVQLESPTASRQPGAWKKELWIADDFDDPLQEAGFGGAVRQDEASGPLPLPTPPLVVQAAHSDPQPSPRPRVRPRAR